MWPSFQHRKGCLQLDAELLFVDGVQRRRSDERLAVGSVALTPALKRGDDIGCPDWLPVVELKAVA